MMKSIKIFFFLAIALSLGQNSLAANNKLAQTGMKFLSIPLDARSGALNGAMTSIDLASSNAMFYNPAGMAQIQGFASTSLGQVKWIADIDYVYGTAAFSPADGQYGVFGLFFLSVDYGTFNATIRAENDQGFLDIGEFSPSAYAIGLSYARALTEKFSIGANVKYAHQNLVGGFVDFDETQSANTDDFKTGVAVFDFGILYKTGFKSLNFGMSVRNFSQEIQYINESFQLPLTFKIGVSIDAFDLYELDKDQHSMLMLLEASHPRDYPEQISLAFEYLFMQKVSMRLGYTTPTDEYNISYGLGYQQDFAGMNLGLDYSFTPFGILGDVHRYTFQFSF